VYVTPATTPSPASPAPAATTICHRGETNLPGHVVFSRAETDRQDQSAELSNPGRGTLSLGLDPR
jgi:hypothetical protein